eukprot:6334343-Amphidinium_carterae.1
MTKTEKQQLSILTRRLWQERAKHEEATEEQRASRHTLVGLHNDGAYGYGCSRCGRHSISREFVRLIGSTCNGAPRAQEKAKAEAFKAFQDSH